MSKESEAELDHGYLLSILDYDPETGIFTWKIKRRGAQGRGDGKLAGGVHSASGYHRIRIDGVLFLSHRLAWFYVFGEWPQVKVDHRNLNRSDNRLCNLRLASHSQNQWNQGVSKRNKSGHKNVAWYKAYGMWQVQVGFKGKTYNGGYFTVLEDAVASANALRERLHGEFAMC